ncbi:MAG: hypothetical protein JO113_07300 [Candidatus Eremiobacteraeota bacterium]|nr:hypothetical protein [Candidatus Eremiobacteraeota bacterium]
MENKRHLFAVLAGAAVLSLGLVACHGAPSGPSSYLPTSSAVTTPQNNEGQAPDSAVIVPDKRDRHEIVSSCGTHVHIILLGVVGCNFHERGYGNRTFAIKNNTSGIVVISPMKGNRATTFEILGAVVGSGNFVVYSRYERLRVRVTVTL